LITRRLFLVDNLKFNLQANVNKSGTVFILSHILFKKKSLNVSLGGNCYESFKVYFAKARLKKEVVVINFLSIRAKKYWLKIIASGANNT